MSITQYDPAIINPGLDQLRAQQNTLTAQNQAIKDAADGLLAIWTGQGADAFRDARTAWEVEFSDTLAALRELITKSETAMNDALMNDARISTTFHG